MKVLFLLLLSANSFAGGFSQSAIAMLDGGDSDSPFFIISSTPFYVNIRSTGQAPVGEALATRCVNAAGTAFEACGGTASGDTPVNIISTFSVLNPGYVQFPSAQSVNAAISGSISNAGFNVNNSPTIANTAFGATQSGTWDINSITNSLKINFSSGTTNNPLFIVSSGIPATQSGTWDVGVNNFPSISTIRGSVALSSGTTSNPLFVVSSGIPAIIQDGGNTITVDATSWPLPTDAATQTTLAALNAKVTACNTGAVAGSVNSSQSGAWNVSLGSGTSALPLFVVSSGIPIVSNSPLNINYSSGTTNNPFFVVSSGIPANQSGTWTVQPGNTQNTSPWVITPSTQTLKSAAFSLVATGTAIALVAGKRLRVYAVKLIASAAISVNFRSGAASNLEGAMPIVANGGFVESANPPSYLFQTASGESLDLVVSGAGTASGRISYWEE